MYGWDIQFVRKKGYGADPWKTSLMTLTHVALGAEK
jgi:hypothetical protein